ncbi:MAG: ATP-binding protein, partial [Actinomycetota bacterium]|nr:ATP-binding protein [Actinomycetota bacterium]
ESCLYRIAKEAVSNVVRHAGAQEFCVDIVYGDGVVCLTVHDNGRGFSPAEAADIHGRDGMGLLSMEQRVTREGGYLMIKSELGSGTTVEVELPLGRV